MPGHSFIGLSKHSRPVGRSTRTPSLLVGRMKFKHRAAKPGRAVPWRAAVELGCAVLYVVHTRVGLNMMSTHSTRWVRRGVALLACYLLLLAGDLHN